MEWVWWVILFLKSWWLSKEFSHYTVFVSWRNCLRGFSTLTKVKLWRKCRKLVIFWHENFKFFLKRSKSAPSAMSKHYVYMCINTYHPTQVLTTYLLLGVRGRLIGSAVFSSHLRLRNGTFPGNWRRPTFISSCENGWREEARCGAQAEVVR